MNPLLISVFIIATCGLIYELIMAALASYLLGDSIYQFSIIIGTYLFSMGIGSYLSRFIARGLINKFIQVEITLGLVGGVSASILFLAFSFNIYFPIILFFFVIVIGALVGMEIPLLLRILQDKLDFRELVSRVLALDYIGALAASILFPLVLVPRLGLPRSALLFGILNTLVGFWLIQVLKKRIGNTTHYKISASFVLVFLVSAFIQSDKIYKFSEGFFYGGEKVILSRHSPYQKIVVTKSQKYYQLYLNGHLQFSSKDEYRYHEALVYPAIHNIKNPENVLILGGGDGLAAREILKNKKVKQITLVDLDPLVTHLFKTNPLLISLNKGSLNNPRLKVINSDAFVWLKQKKFLFDLIVMDFPDPSNYSLGKLYSKTFFKILSTHLNIGGLAVMQTSSPLFAPRSYWCITKTAKYAGWQTYPYHNYVPAFGDWGYLLMSHKKIVLKHDYPNYKEHSVHQLKYLTPQISKAMFLFPADMKPPEVEINELRNQILIRYYQEDWRENDK